MNKENIIKSLNLTTGEVLTLEKAKDRMEFEALPIMSIPQSRCGLLIGGDDNSCKCDLGNYEQPCNSYCSPDSCYVDVPVIPCIDDCDCVGPHGYISHDDCHPYKG